MKYKYYFAEIVNIKITPSPNTVSCAILRVKIYNQQFFLKHPLANQIFTLTVYHGKHCDCFTNPRRKYLKNILYIKTHMKFNIYQPYFIFFCTQESKTKESYELNWSIPKWKLVRMDEDLVNNQKIILEAHQLSQFQTKWAISLKVIPNTFQITL